MFGCRESAELTNPDLYPYYGTRVTMRLSTLTDGEMMDQLSGQRVARESIG